MVEFGGIYPSFNSIYTTSSEDSNWVSISGKLKTLRVLDNGRVWGINSND